VLFIVTRSRRNKLSSGAENFQTQRQALGRSYHHDWRGTLLEMMLEILSYKDQEAGYHKPKNSGGEWPAGGERVAAMLKSTSNV
jgi:hypothetical protein